MSADYDAGAPGDSDGNCEDCGALVGHYDDCPGRHDPTVTDYLRATAERFGLDPDEVEHAHLLKTTGGDA